MLNKSFARRIGKKLSKTSKDLIDQKLPLYTYSNQKINQRKKIFLEIGIGNGEHLINQMSLNPDNCYIAAEPYINGIAKFLKLSSEFSLENFLIWNDDANQLLKLLPNEKLSGIFILFPDPWNKKKYKKRRFLNKERLLEIKLKLLDLGFIIFASDIEEYFLQVKALCIEDPNLTIVNSNFNEISYPGYIKTKYHQKALNNSSLVYYIYVIYNKRGTVFF
ncbi:tRNA (guanosine(46)-N7)-methyltransferase TrmB [Rickettsia endosymbiont of Cardiosporidium cionae]|uniref:tRNA (guanosine(46)-N7)-methyltransferase TrmB n=1 Tax=Rickettsia endosymbiont of Cardiosporidium cionae TaxID=2777155 RepID=UPI001894E542|nr:tRNA (guanosine(46)-N7)-methyltransferase TrmB [Rickettsia endosymbiont of Cardiosporidium cionae]KAF8818343.1 bifunctional peptide chain release factor N(5)-glutamine methyltransferase PrmC/tRNA (guanosine(46)-N7)-methyltransferase TrmB [Rickettsia endosymbiont of Cardiosporidium cionae]